ncbi:SCP2 domain-containing protein [Ralstonia solanacearum]|uniref:ubiquinone biosynthesis accessory factor UbiJ n=1 Tax=Ralstonia solanacearum TaxID=305 RepID=UPI0005C5829F|nr:SCP2 domain-containing protein [Ralstonia solanacearum]MBB6592075.1 SCP2 domain-containing protein [Ralstonia solanacearum]MBB6596298.1 SCP2 domain-containing protein [Ralstonia solanacearum]MDB0541789.1 SCP2 domain-containing protein [Ralstonia solanacearum]MDB0552021.1 SCP2 domain-containing protein [Ralstonia solanacearum]MDB0556725.1 SCP2 domain-containing protein [Ralstonia solanacearum]
MSSTASSSPFPIVLMQPLLLALNHLLRQEPWAQAMLRPFAGRVAHFDLAPFTLSLQVDAGGLVMAPEPGVEPAVRVVVPLAAAAGDYATGGQAAVLKHVRIEGEAEFANVLSTLLRNVRWDAAEDLSRVFGDVLAQRMVRGAQSIRTEAMRTGRSLVDAVASYLTDEQPTLVRHARLAQFAADVAVARDDAARLEKRLERLERAARGMSTARAGESA